MPSGKEFVVIFSGAACTCTVSVVLPVTPDNAAVMVALPGDAPVASPLAKLIVATAVLDDVHVAWLVIFCVLPSE